MARLVLWRSQIEAARLECVLSKSETKHIESLLARSEQTKLPVDTEVLPIPVARFLLEDPRLQPNQRAVLAIRAHGMQGGSGRDDELYAFEAHSPVEFGSALLTSDGDRPNAELAWNGRWYPVQLIPEFNEDREKRAKNVSLTATLSFGAFTHRLSWPVEPRLFEERPGVSVKRSVGEVLESMGFRRRSVSVKDYNLRLAKAERLAARTGHQLWAKGAVLDLSHRFFFGETLNQVPLGTPDAPRRTVAEPALEGRSDDYGGQFMRAAPRFEEGLSRMSLVRIFSFDLKAYVFADVDDLDDYVYDDQAFSRLFLPPDMKTLLRQVFETPQEELFGDLIRGRHGGVVVLASGSPGVGKTFTAEVYSEMTERPLYVLEFGELGTTVTQIEENLRLIFARVVRWRAVLQFDECEIFLAQRGQDLERSAIVGIFLRMLDYYEGILFLTTNRPDVLDEAIHSRVMLNLAYPDLDPGTRQQVWRAMFHAAGLTLQDDAFDSLASIELDGRGIRNLVRLLGVVLPERAVSLDDVHRLLPYSKSQADA
ncbi:MAG: AAA family ATPase [Planctomycetota bacterium]